jgi:hypothetical protein
MTAGQAITPFHFVALAVIIRLVLMSARSKNYFWVLVLTFSMQNKCFQNTSEQSYGHLHLNVLRTG